MTWCRPDASTRLKIAFPDGRAGGVPPVVALMRVILVLLSGGAPALAAAYDYPFMNPYEATVIGTPSFYQPALTEYPPVKDYEITVFDDRRVPDVFWYTRFFRFSLVSQKESAPLVFVIAGTGSSHESAAMQMFQKAFFDAGFHVLSLSSPTHPNFIVNASTTRVPGHLVEDAEDLYRVMAMAYDRVRDDIDVTECHLMGYSLGGAQAAMVANIDDQKKRFGFRRVLMINPPVSLYHSAGILDRLLNANLSMDPGAVDRFFDKYMTLFSEIYRRNDLLKFDEDFLFHIYKAYPQKEKDLQILIGLSFRNAATSMIFVSDVMSRSGFVVPPERELGPTDSLTDYFKVLGKTGFTDYFDEFFLPFFRNRYPALSEAQLKHQMSLKGIESFLREADHIGLLHNEDDIILARGELAYLLDVFQSRAIVFPTGGHLGNLAHQEVVAAILSFFKEARR
jgi:pimeloyl-ACP methyl ester carboxylesterase